MFSVSKLPLYAIKNEKDGSTGDDSENSLTEEPQRTCFLHNLLLGEWEDRMNRGLFRYDVTTCKTKVIPGDYGFIAQLNEGRHLKKRPTEFRVDQVLQPFDDNKFNFTKIGQEEVLFRIQQSNDFNSQYFPSGPADLNSLSVVAINVCKFDISFFLLFLRKKFKCVFIEVFWLMGFLCYN